MNFKRYSKKWLSVWVFDLWNSRNCPDFRMLIYCSLASLFFIHLLNFYRFSCNKAYPEFSEQLTKHQVLWIKIMKLLWKYQLIQAVMEIKYNGKLQVVLYQHQVIIAFLFWLLDPSQTYLYSMDNQAVFLLVLSNP